MKSAVTAEDELAAARAALTGTPLERARIATRALLSLLRDPNDTRQVFLLGISTNRRSFPRLLARIAMTDEGGEMLRERPSIDSRHVDYAALRALPDGTLGREYARFLDDNHLDPDLFQSPPGLPEVPAYLVQRLRQVHDIWHVVTGYSPDVPGELALQAFSYAQTGTALSLIISVFGTLRWTFSPPPGASTSGPKLIAKTVDGYRRGKRAAFLPVVKFEDMWSLPVTEVREKLRVEAVAA